MDGRTGDQSSQDGLRVSGSICNMAPMTRINRMFVLSDPRSEKRDLLCSRENAERVAARIFSPDSGPISVVRTRNPLQPFRVSLRPARDEQVEVVMVS